MATSPRIVRSITRSLALLFAAGALLTGCGPDDIRFADDIDVEWDLFTLDRPSDAVHVPYVRGTRVVLGLRGDDVTADMHVASLDPNGIAPEEGTRLFHALREGDHRVAAIDGRGRRVRTRTLPVRVPDRVEIQAHGPLIIDRPEPPLAEAQVLVGGTATFLVHYFEGSRQLFGNGVLEIDAPPEVHAVNRTSFLFENREWLTVTVRTPGRHTLQLFADGAPVGRFTVIGVPPETVEVIAMHHDRQRNKHEARRLVWAEPVDLDGESVYGVDFEWDIDGRPVPGLGDIFHYEVNRDVEALLVARFGDRESLTHVNATHGTVGSTNDIGCAVSGAPIGGGGGLALLGLALLGLRLRRRVTAA